MANISGYSDWTLVSKRPEEVFGENVTSEEGVWSGTLLGNHVVERTRMCLPPGDYTFAAPADVSWVRNRFHYPNDNMKMVNQCAFYPLATSGWIIC